MTTTILINYNDLRKINAETTRKSVLNFLVDNKRNITLTARTFGVSRKTIYKILKKENEGCLEDKSKAPHTVHNKTSKKIEDIVIEVKNLTNYGPERIADYVYDNYNLQISQWTARNIIRRNRDKIKHKVKQSQLRRGKREHIDWYSAKPFEIVQIDLKHIRDQKALTQKQIIHLDKYDIPNYQWGALDVNSRFKITAYSKEKSFTNGLCFFLWVSSYLRSNGVTNQIVYTVDNGQEFGGTSWLKIKELRTFLSGFGCKLIQNHKGHPEENAHLERSHRTDDDEFYCIRSELIKSEEDLCEEGTKFMYYYNNLRKHSGIGKKTPYQYLKEQLPEINESIKFVQPFLLDNVAIQLGPWSGYNVLAQNPYSLN